MRWILHTGSDAHEAVRKRISCNTLVVRNVQQQFSLETLAVFLNYIL